MSGNVANEEDKVNSRTSYFLLGGLHLLVLSSFAVARSYFEPLGDAPGFFVERGATALDVWTFALILLLLPSAVCLLVEAAVGLISKRLRTGAHLLFVGLFCSLIGWQAFSDVISERAAEAVGLVLGGLATLAYARLALVRSWLTVLAPAPLVVLALFAVFSPVRPLVLGGELERPRPVESTGAPVVMVVLDELPTGSLLDSRDRIDASRFPGFARLAGRSTWYRDAATVADFTQLAVPSLLTGRAARRDVAQVAAKYPRNLFTLLGGSYRLNVWEFNTDLCPEPVCRQQGRAGTGRRMRKLFEDAVRDIPALPGGLRARLADALEPPRSSPVTPGAAREDVRVQLRASQRVRFERFLASLRPGREPTVDFLHLLLPHRPWTYLPDGTRVESRRPYAASLFAPLPRDSRAIAISYQRHLLQLGYADRLLGRLLARLRRLGVLDRALLVVTADHGASFRPGAQPRIVSRGNVGEIAPVPLFVKRPGQRRGEIVDEPVESIDVLPELARILRVRLPWAVEGRPLGERTRPLVISRRRGGGEVRLTRARLRSLQRAAVVRNHRLVGSDLYALGPGSSFMGRPPPVRARPLAARFDRPLQVDVSGVIDDGPPRVRPLLVVVNGRVAATAWSLVAKGEEYFTAIVRPGTLRRGGNSVRLFELRSGA